VTDDQDRNSSAEPDRPANSEVVDFETVPTTAADVESAGRSCMAIIVILGLIVLVLAVWLTLRSFGVGS
jgi:hypothetical protein